MAENRGERNYVLGTHDEEIERLGLQHHVWRLPYPVHHPTSHPGRRSHPFFQVDGVAVIGHAMQLFLS